MTRKWAGLAALATVVATPVVAAEEVWKQDFEYVKLEAVNAANQQPVSISPEQVSWLLGAFQRKTRDSVAPLFDNDQLERIAKPLARALAQAKPSDDILFASTYRAYKLFFTPRVANSGRLFVENGRLNLILGACEAEFEGMYRATGVLRPFAAGSRMKPAKLDCELVAGPGAAFVNQRADWLAIDLSQANQPAPAHPTTILPTPAVVVPPAAPAATPAAAVPAAPVAGQPAVLPAVPLTKSEERLMVLKRLKDNGLITESEYQQKRAAILKDL
ncbi:SHOCT domain-containing protein [Chitinimonas lacunae]|uniref:SHOCT domain-containing protein n=1 Tax=Chitinimonas lacunae TaxID=1963018 RepID=A0ABV8MKZ8_9NEIS